MSYAKGFRAAKRRHPEDNLDSSPTKVPKVEETEDTEVLQPFYSPKDLRAMAWAEKKGVVSKNWNVVVTLCKGDAPSAILEERIEFLKQCLLHMPERAGFIYAGDITFHKSKGAGNYSCRIAFALDANISYGALVRGLGAFDVPNKADYYYGVEPAMGFPYWGLVGPVHDRYNTGVVYRAGPLHTRGEPRNTILPVRYFLNGLRSTTTAIPEP